MLQVVRIALPGELPEAELLPAQFSPPLPHRDLLAVSPAVRAARAAKLLNQRLLASYGGRLRIARRTVARDFAEEPTDGAQ